MTQLAKGIVRIIHHEFRRKIDLIVDRQYTEKRIALTGRQIMDQIFSFFDNKKTHGRTMSMAD